jgi:hypothetical protein
MEYTITQVKGDYESKYPDSRKYVFRVSEYPHDLSAFSKFPMVAGEKIHGTIVQNGSYHNFRFEKKDLATPTRTVPTNEVGIQLNKIREELYALRVSLQSHTQWLQEHGLVPQKEAVGTIEYPENPRDGIAEEDLPF